MAVKLTLPIPGFFNPDNLYDPNYRNVIAWPVVEEQPDKTQKVVKRVLREEANRYRRHNGVKKVRPSAPRIGVLGIDPQRDFCATDGSLQVSHALEALLKFIRWAYKNLQYIATMGLTMDDHMSTMVSHAHFLIDVNGNHPEYFTTFTAEDFRTGKWRVNPTIVPMLPGGKSEEFINEFLAHYCDELARRGLPQLRCWPEHCLMGSAGQAVVGAIEELHRFHEFELGTYNPVFKKGQSPFLECFSAVGPDITTFQDGSPIPGAVINEELLTWVRGLDILIVWGVASTHCVPATILRLIELVPELASKMYILGDATAPVEGLEFLEDEANVRYDELGIPRVSTMTSMYQWPGKIRRVIREIEAAYAA